MKLTLTTIKDIITGEAIQAPQLAKNTAEAKRIFERSIKQLSEDKTTTVPYKDFQLFCIGTFDSETLEITSEVEYLCSAQEYIK